MLFTYASESVTTMPTATPAPDFESDESAVVVTFVFMVELMPTVPLAAAIELVSVSRLSAFATTTAAAIEASLSDTRSHLELAPGTSELEVAALAVYSLLL